MIKIDFFPFLPAQLGLRVLIGEEEKLQEIDALAHPTGMMVCSRSAQLENVAFLRSTSPPRKILASSRNSL